jgi:hypothetical protein
MISILHKKRTPTTVLGLALDGHRLEGVLVHRSNGSLQILKSFATTLALNPINGSPELVGREIRNCLDQVGVREKRCTVCVPLNWALAVQTTIPEMPEEDIAGFLEIEAEKGFPYSPDALFMATSRCRGITGGGQATLVAIPRNHLEQLEAVLKAAQLRPLSFSLGITALQDAERESSHGVIALTPGESAIDLQVSCHGGVAALRSLEEAVETEGVQKRLEPDQLAREIRVTLGQLPDALRGVLRKIRIFGTSDPAQRLSQDLVSRVAPMGLQIELVRTYAPDEFRSKPPPDTSISAAFSLAARYLTNGPSRMEFLPPKISAWQHLTSRFASRKLGWIGATAGAAAALILGAILFQHWQLSRLNSQWNGMAKQVTELEGMQAQIRHYRPWFDDSFKSLSILRRLTEAFPDTGSVTAKSVEIRDSSTITCSGTARDNQSFLHMLDQLRASREVGNVKVDQLRGKAPLQFTLNFQWAHGGGGEN